MRIAHNKFAPHALIIRLCTRVLQDRGAAAIFGEKSYNEVVERLVNIMGSETPKHLLTGTSSRSMRRTTGSAPATPQVRVHDSLSLSVLLS